MITQFKKHATHFHGVFIILLMLVVSMGNKPISAQVTNTAGLMQFTSGGHALGFAANGMYAVAGSHALHVDFVDAANVQPQANSPASADGGTPRLNRVTYLNLWPGINLAYDAPMGTILRSTYTLQPGADPKSIRLHYNAPLALNQDGTLGIAFESGTMTESAPIAWQDIAGQRVSVNVRFSLSSPKAQTVTFAVAAYDPRYSLTIDPGLTWNTFLGGSTDDFSRGLTVDGNGDIYVTGNSAAAWSCIPTSCTVNAYTGDYDAFVAKLNGTTGNLVWNTFLGASTLDDSMGIAADGNGNIYISGYSNNSWGTPIRDNNGGVDGFTAKLNSATGALIWNTFLGGSALDRSWGVDVDGNGNVYITGNSTTAWSCSPTDCTVRPFGAVEDAYIAKLDSSGTLIWNTFLGGDGTDVGYGITVDGGGNAYVTGYSTANWGSPLRAYSGDSDGFAAKLDTSGGLIWNTFLGGTGTDLSYGIALDGTGDVYVAGASYAAWGSPLRAFGGGTADGFVAKLNPAGALAWNTFLGGSGYDYTYNIAVDATGNIYVAGSSDAAWGYPLRDYTDDLDGFAAKLNSSGVLKASTFLGGSGQDKGYGIAVFGGGENVYVSGYSSNSWGSPLRTYTSGKDTFVAKVDLTPPVVGSIKLANADPNNTASVNFNVTFSEPVTGVDTSDFILALKGTTLTGVTISGITGTDANYTVTVATGSGNGTLRLDVVDDDTILNDASVPLGGAGAGNGNFTKGAYYSIVKTAPVLYTPLDTSLLLTNIPTFDWSDFPGAVGYQIQVAKDSAFKSILLTKTSTVSTYTYTKAFPNNTLLYWRVHAKVGKAYGDWSDTFTFTTANPPSVPVLVAPASKALVNGPSPLFDWKDSTIPSGAIFDHYQIQIAKDLGFTNIVYTKNVTTSQDNTAVLAVGASYYWRVRAYNTLGAYSGWSLVRNVRIKYLAPTLLTPASGETGVVLMPTFTWDITIGATSYSLQVSKASNFSSFAVNKTLTSPTFTATVNLSAATTYYWRVRSNGPFGPSDYSIVFTFTTQ